MFSKSLQISATSAGVNGFSKVPYGDFWASLDGASETSLDGVSEGCCDGSEDEAPVLPQPTNTPKESSAAKIKRFFFIFFSSYV